MDVFQVVQMVPNRVKHHNYFTDFLKFFWYLGNVFENVSCPQKLFWHQKAFSIYVFGVIEGTEVATRGVL